MTQDEEKQVRQIERDRCAAIAEQIAVELAGVNGKVRRGSAGAKSRVASTIARLIRAGD